MLTGRDLIVFGEDFGRHPHCLEHIVRQFLPANRVLWVETIGLRSPRWSIHDARRSFEIASKWILHRASRETPGPESLARIAPITIPFNRIGGLRRWNTSVVARHVEKTVARLGFHSPIVIASVLQACDIVDRFGANCIVYHCVDDFTLWPGVDPRLAASMEQLLIAKSTLRLASSQVLCNSRSTHERPFYLLTHGVDLNHFRLPNNESEAVETLCYFGLVDERTDLELLVKIAARFPDCRLTVIGPRVVSTTALAAHPNIVLKDAVSYANLPTAIRDQHAFLLPYRLNEATRSINPLKLKEYLATGRPVVATALPEVEKLAPHVLVAEDHEGMLRHIAQLREQPDPGRRERALEFLQRSETWCAKAEQMSQWILDVEAAGLATKLSQANSAHLPGGSEYGCRPAVTSNFNQSAPEAQH